METDNNNGHQDLKEITKQRLLKDVIRSVKPAGGWKILVIDKVTVRIISAAARMYDIMEEGITVVEKIDIKREPLPKLEAIYFLAPTPESIDILIQDFADAKKPQYAAVHLFLTQRLPDDLLKKIQQSNVKSRIKTLMELYMDFVAYESSVFHFDSPNSFHLLFSPESTDGAKEQRRIADKLVTVMTTLKEYPIVRYSNATPVAHSLAALVQDRLDHMKNSSAEFAALANSPNRATLLILDRAFDVMTPILHEFTYQAMLYDLLKIENDHYTYTAKTNANEDKAKEVILSEVDPLWPTLRHMHIAECMNWIIDGFNTFMAENKGASKLSSGGKVNTLKEMSDAIRGMPQYQEMLDKYSLHINMSGKAMEIFKGKDLSRLAGIEQDMSTGEDSDGKPAKNLVSNLPPILSDPDVTLGDKIRLLMIYIISQEGIKESDRQRLMDLAHIPVPDQSCISNLRYLGVTLLKGNKSVKKQDVKKNKKDKKRDDAPPYELSRYVPMVKKLGEDIIGGALSNGEYPAVKEDLEYGIKADSKVGTPQAVASKRTSLAPKWDKKGKKDKVTPLAGSRVIIFVAGGITHSEMRSVYELQQKYSREVILGSTAVVTPDEFIGQLKNLKAIETAEDGKMA